MLARFSDGKTFHAFKMDRDFDLTAKASFIKDEINLSKMIFTIPGKISVPPVFVGDVAVFYIKDVANVGRLHFYKLEGATIIELHVVQVDTCVNKEF